MGGNGGKTARDFGPASRRGRVGGAAVVLAAALLLHVAALGAFDAGPLPGRPLAAAPPIAIRIVPAPALPTPVAEATGPSVEASVVPKTPISEVRGDPASARTGRHARRAPATPVAPGAAPADAPRPEPPAAIESASATAEKTSGPVRLAAASGVAEPAASAEADPESEPIPHYRTRVPPPVSLRYDVRRGALSGVGQIDWRADGSHYDLKLEFRYAGLLILEQSSAGGFDADGLAPDRFVDRRIRRSAQAANFQRATRRLTYSGSSDEHPLRPGAQDRLSWMVQLAAIVAADPALARPGGRVTMFVTGARGDIAVWTFRCTGPELLELRGGRTDTLRFVREAAHERDTSVRAWLDPARGYLPVAASQQSGPDDEPYELRLTEASEPH